MIDVGEIAMIERIVEAMETDTFASHEKRYMKKSKRFLQTVKEIQMIKARS